MAARVHKGVLARSLGMIGGVVGRAVGAVKASYEAASHGRRMRGWTVRSSGPNAAIAGVQTIRNRARDATRNDWSGESGVQKWTTSLIGTGIVPRFKRLTKARRTALMTLWANWVKVADADGVLNFYGLQSLAVRAWLESGEVFIRRRMRSRGADRLPVPMQIQLIEADQVPMLDAETYPGLPTDNVIRSGIEFDRRGRRVAYWMFRQHPGERQTGNVDPSRLLRVRASEVIHMFEPKRIGQLRGVSMQAVILAKLRNVENFDDAVLTRQMLANLFAMFIKQATPTGYDENTDPLTGGQIETDDDGPIAALEPGISQRLLPGEEVQFSNPPEAGTTYSDYIRTQHLGTAAGQGLPYELFTGDILTVSDRTLRVIINEFRRFAEQRQWQIVIPMMCEGVMEWFAYAAALDGSIRSEVERENVIAAEWAPHGWQYIHPVQDVQGKKLEVEAGFRSRSSVIGERGDDPDSVDEERAADVAREKTLDLYVDPKPIGAALPGPAR